MGGVFGSYLAFIKGIGGIILMILIGKKAWQGTNTAGNFRLVFGSVFIGALIGPLLMHFGVYGLISGITLFLNVVVIPFGVLLFSVMLESIKRLIES